MKSILNSGGFESFSLNKIAVFCNQRSKLLPKFVFKMSFFRCYTCAWQHATNLIDATDSQVAAHPSMHCTCVKAKDDHLV